MKRNKIGLPAGELIHVGSHSSKPMQLTRIVYNEEFLREDTFDFQDKTMPGAVRWIQVEGVHDAAVMQELGSTFGLHPLVLEDIMTTRQRPKVDEYEEYIFIVLRLVSYDETSDHIEDEQLSLILGKGQLISFQEKPNHIFDPLKERLRQSKGMIRKCGADFLTYALIDTVVDYYFILLDSMGNKIEILEDALDSMSTHKGLGAIHLLRREIVLLRKSLLPMREVINRLMRDNASPLLTDTTKFYLKDVYDHAIQVIDTIDTYRELSRGLLDVNLSHMSFRMNEVIKILTVVSTIFVPITFISSFYGMNFTYMPELHWKYGYLVVTVIMILVVLFMIRFFKKKKWF